VRYTTILFDLDHTLFDFDASEELAFADAMAAVGLTGGPEQLATYRRINDALWAAAERGEIRSSTIRNIRFAQLAEALGLDADAATVAAMADAFIAGLGEHGDLYPGTRDVLDALAVGASLAVVSNGLGEVVYERMARLGLSEFFDSVVVSSEVGVAKPNPVIFGVAFERLGSPDKRSALMVGDSLTSDIAGGAAFGIDTCWLNWRRHRSGADAVFTHEIGNLVEVLSIAS
jgi:YjjG family noncanonical pyrimidine nucleotidase